MKAAVVSFPGSNRERDIMMALERASGVKPSLLWHGDAEIPDTDLIVVPGGFSYGDYLRCGAMAAHSPVMKALKEKAARGTPVLGVCNGFQILVEAGLLPGALMRNASLKFVCRQVHLRVEDSQSLFTNAYEKGQVIRVPVAHAEGNYTADEDTLKKLEDRGLVAFRYVAPDGSLSPEANPNGSIRAIAGIFNDSKTVLGLMPHPEDATDPHAGGMDGFGMFKSLVNALH
ncbi:MAG: phosphoribosylformylglycinamidine synthase subunit PurQ [Alphaproteobacteria bacterium]|nr:phosphoribosylformylglycinamidine synthase subunit PurQ [Alphaproteobacteria bacterium]